MRISTQTTNAEEKRISKNFRRGLNLALIFCFVQVKKSIQKTWGKIWGNAKTWGKTWGIKLWGKIWGWGKSWGGVRDVNMG